MRHRATANANLLQAIPIEFGTPPDGEGLVYDATLRRYRPGAVRAYATTTGAFTQPATNAAVTVSVAATAWMAPGQMLYIASGGHYVVISITDDTHVVLSNPGFASNASTGASIASGSAVSPAGLAGPQGPQGATGATGSTGVAGTNAYATSTAGFTMPGVNGNVTLSVDSSAPFAVGMYVFVESAGYLTVASKPSSVQLQLTNTGQSGNAAPTTSIGRG